MLVRMWTQKLPGLETSPRVGGMKPAAESGEVCMRDQVTSRSQPLAPWATLPCPPEAGAFFLEKLTQKVSRGTDMEHSGKQS